MTKIYCLRQKKFTETKNEHIERTNNGKMRIVGECIECGAKKSKFIKASSKQGGSLAEAGYKALYHLGRAGLASAVKSKTARNMMKTFAPKYVDQGIDSITSDLSKKLKPKKLGYGSFDVHNAILRIAPEKGFTMPGHRYTGPGNPLHKQLKHYSHGNILEIYEKPTGKTDAVSMHYDVNYTICGNKPKNEQVSCKNKADHKMVKGLDAIPWNQRQWGHAIARNAISTKAKLGMGKSKNVKSRRVKKTGKKN